MEDKSIDRLLFLFENNDKIKKIKIENEIISFTEKKYKSKINEKCNFCKKKPTIIWNCKNKITKVCKKCCKKNRNIFFL